MEEKKKKQIITDEELEEAFASDESTEDNSFEEEAEDEETPEKPDIAELYRHNKLSEEIEERKKRKKAPLVATIIILILIILGGVFYTKFFILDEKDREISDLNSNNEIKEKIINQLGIDLNQFSTSLQEADDDLKKATESLENANSTLNFLLKKSSSQIASRYLAPFSGWTADFSKYNFFEKGIDSDDYRRYITLANSQFEGEYNEEIEQYISILKLNLASETYKDLFGTKTTLKEDKSDITWCSSVANSYFDVDLFEGTGGFRIPNRYDEKACEFEKTFFYGVDGYEATDDGFFINIKVAFATKKEAEEGGSVFEIKLDNGETAEWGGPSCRTSSESFVEENKENLPTYKMNFKKDGDNFYLDSITK